MTQAKKWKKQKRKEREKRQRWEILIDYLDSNDEVQTLGRSIHRSQLMNFVKNAENVVSAADLSGFTYFGVALYLSQRAKTTPRPQETMDRLINKTLGGLSVYGKSSLLEKSHEVLRPCHVRYVYDWPSEILECLPHTIDADDVVGIRCLGEVDFEDLITGRVEKQQVTFRLVQKRGDPNKYNVDENQKWMLRKWAYEMSEIICGRQSDYSTPKYDRSSLLNASYPTWRMGCRYRCRLNATLRHAYGLRGASRGLLCLPRRF